jgi:hypothetical protein
MRPLALLLGLVVFGCSSTPPASTGSQKEEAAVQEAPVTKVMLYEQLHSGMFQTDAAVKKVIDALDLARAIQAKATPDLAEAIKDMIDALDAAGAALADASGGEPPTQEQVDADEALYRSKRDRLVTVIDGTLKDIREQMGVAADLAENGPDAMKNGCAKVDILLNQVIDDLVGALDGLGVKSE